jgi:hypothetical protein
MVAKVTTILGSPRPATSHPFAAPINAPAKIAHNIAADIGIPAAAAVPAIIDHHAPIRVLAAVRGHPFDRTALAALFDGMEGISVTFVDQPAAGLLMRPELADDFGVVALHHALAGWPAWPDYAGWLGGTFLYRAGTLRGEVRPDSGYRHEVAYSAQVVANARAVAAALVGHGYTMATGGTDNHLVLWDLRPLGVTGAKMQAVCDETCITLNKNTIPDDPRSPFVTSGVRIGTPAVTTQGMTEPEMVQIASLIARALRGRADDAAIAAVRADVAALCADFTPYS